MQKIIKRSLAVIGVIILVLAGAFYIYVSDYYHADNAALKVMAEEDVAEGNGLITLAADMPSDTAIIFYPGAKVDLKAYLPLLNGIRNRGYAVYGVEMPFHMAIFDSDAAAGVMAARPEIQHWYIMGHSMGGAMASSFAAGHADQIDGLILLGAYPYGDYPIANTLTVYGSLNTSVAEKIDYTDNVVVIDGGNHAQFGNYGAQKGDAKASITAEDQQAQTVEAVDMFIQSRE